MSEYEAVALFVVLTGYAARNKLTLKPAKGAEVFVLYETNGGKQVFKHESLDCIDAFLKGVER